MMVNILNSIKEEVDITSGLDDNEVFSLVSIYLILTNYLNLIFSSESNTRKVQRPE